MAIKFGKKVPRQIVVNNSWPWYEPVIFTNITHSNNTYYQLL